MPDPRYVASISANGKVYTGWKSLTVRREYADMTSSFSFTVSDANGEAAGLLPGAQCVITLGGQKALTGWITSRGCMYDAENHDVVIAGKSLTCDVADSCVKSLGSLNGYTLEQIARGALAPYKVNLQILNPPPNIAKPFEFYAVNPGETALDHIERACRMRGCFLWDNENGELCIGQGPGPNGAIVADLQERGNILRMIGKLDDQASMGLWSIFGQQPSTDQHWPARNSQATVVDPTARPSRTQIIHAPHPGDSDDMLSYAGLLAARSGWHAVELEVTVAGWLRPDGKLWSLTENISVYSPMALPNGTGMMTLGTQEIVFSQDRDGGTTTTLSLKRPELLTSVGHVGAVSNSDGSFPEPGTIVPPDTNAAPL